jgi:hypothetical protein
VLVILILIACLAAMLFGLTLLRAAAISDRSHASALAEWIAESDFAQQQDAPADPPVEHPRFDRRGGAYRATGGS